MTLRLSPAQRRLLEHLSGGPRTLSGTDLVVARALRRKSPKLTRPTGFERKVLALNGRRIREQRWSLTAAGQREADRLTFRIAGAPP